MPNIATAARGLSLDFPGTGVRLSGCCPEIVYTRAGRRQTWKAALAATSEGFAGQSEWHGLATELTIARRDAAAVLSLSLTNAGTDTIFLSSIAPLAVDAAGSCRVGPNATWSVFRQGYQSWTGTRSFRTDQVDRDPLSELLRVGLIDVRHPSAARPGYFRSEMFTLVKNLQSAEALLAGFLACRGAFGAVEVWVDGSRCVRFAPLLDYDEIPIEPGNAIVTEPLWLAAGNNEVTLLAAYADAAGNEMQARVPARNPVGWCSWYYYFTRITEDRIVENVRALASLRERERTQFPCEYVQVDDGYQAAIGDWLRPNTKFPRGMGWVAEQIRAAGFDAGIWTAPFIAKPDSNLMKEHPDWFVTTANRRPRFALWNPLWGLLSSCYALDTTHPAVLDWLRQTFHTIAREWGYRVLKLDFLFAAALPGERHDRRATRAMALRRGLAAIREGAGDDAFLIGCGCPLGPAIGIVDAMRIGPDVAPFWTNILSRGAQRDLHGLATKHAVRNILTRAFLHRRWWLNDPDCLMVRDTKTKLTEEEVRSLATAIAVTGGMIVLSDRVEQLSAERLGLLDQTLQLSGAMGEVVDLMQADMPELVVARGSELTAERTIVATFNFADVPRTKVVDLKALVPSICVRETVEEWWSGTRLPVIAGQVDFGPIPPHGCRVLVLEDEREAPLTRANPGAGEG